MCLQRFQPKRTSGSVYGSQVAVGTLFLQQGGVSVNEEVLKVVGSCFRSGLMFGICLQTLPWLVPAGMRDVVVFAKLLLF